ncbi:hypothetical protein SAMD00019534_122640 [Acytostelium subglobosum LB1]|uniref:hypothetical protein n=1 Tax=Acytostelium subglobosum LB1 TaxID=1410327 RepID=UPI0006447EE7|nr:hypothetical protein SAMD00019534_122640 [Acytostelium subglobosum LB1]GAM29088.1 hypothetical protein SAMD00019534_122640 [Acytostelium subglobosum LB1]|eukprot:XP_012747933.1 hypothetical protein SAMD00019534_122640 [Acytostelium subglobosum LB1]
MFKPTLFVCLLVLLSCVSATDVDESAASVAISGNYYFFRSSGIVCVKDPCPSWLASDINGETQNITVHYLSFAPNLNQTVIFEAANEEVIVYGYLIVYYDRGTPIRRLNVRHAFRQLPLSPEDQETKSGQFYFVDYSGIACITTPCPSWKATALNGGDQYIADNYIEPYSNYAYFDSNWLSKKVLDTAIPYKAIVQANIFESTIIGKAIYVNILDPIEKCPPVPIVDCIRGLVPVYTRDSNRCKKFTACIKPGACTREFPTCDVEGYSLVTFPSKPNACTKAFCDASFLSQQ